MSGVKHVVAAGLATLITGSVAHAVEIQVDFTNDAPAGGTYLTPAWVGFHDGSFDTFDAGAGASAALEALAEDGNTGPLFASFASADGMAGGAPVAPGATVSTVVSVDADGSDDFFSFASMVLPSTDYFIGNDSPTATSIAGLLDGTFSQVTISVIGVFDAGTEVNTFDTSAGNPLFGIPGGQGVPGEGTAENGLVTLVTVPYGNYPDPGVDISGLDFSTYDSVATFTLSVVPIPVPAALPLMLSAVGGLAFTHRRSRRR